VRRSNLLIFLLIPFLAAFSFGQSPFPASAASNLPRRSNTSGTVSLPLVFEANRGQADGGVDFIAQVRGYRAGIGASRVILGLDRASGDAVVMNLAGANQQARARGEEKLPGHSNYLIGSDPAKWITGVEQYAKVRYRDVYPGIDLLFHGSQNRLEQDFVVRPGASPKRIRLYFQGVQRVELTSDGALVLRTGDDAVKMQNLRAYQVVRDREVEVPVRYELRNAQARFRLGSYDRRRALIIDPVLVFATFLGGTSAVAVPGTSGVDQAVAGMAADASGVYITGRTISTSFPVTSGVVGTNPQSVFVSKLDPTGQSLIFSTYLAGFQGESVLTLTVDSSENIYIAGVAATGLPIPSGSKPFQGTIHGAENLAILKLNSTGTAVLAATYLGGSGGDYFNGIAVDSSENVYVTGQTTSNDFPLQNALQGSLGTSGSNAFVTKLNPTLSGLLYSTYLGGNSDVGTAGVDIFTHSIALDSSGDAYVIGVATAGFPTTSGAYQSTCPANQEEGPSENCVFLAKLNANDSALLYATYLGDSSGAGDATETPTAVAVDSAEDAYIAGLTYSASFPVVNPIQSCSAIEGIGSNNNPSGNFLSEFNSAGALTFSTCLGINQSDEGIVIYASFPVLTLDVAGDAYFGASSGSGLPLENPIDANEPAQARPFVSEISADTHTLLFSSFVAGPLTFGGDPEIGSGDLVNAIAVDSSGDIYLAGSSTAGTTYSAGYSYFPVFNPLQPYFFNPGGCPPEDDSKPLCIYTNGFIMKVAPSAGAAAASVPAELQFPTTNVGTTSAPLGTTIYDLGTDALTVSNVAASGDFAVKSNSCGTVPSSGGNCAIQVTFTPTAMGTRNGTLTITDSSAGSPHRVTLTGLGATALTVSPTQLTFSQATGSTSPPQTVTLTAGVDAVEISRIQVSGDFSETNNCGTSIAAGRECEIHVSFTPQTAGQSATSLRLWMWAFLIAGWIILPGGMSTKHLARRYLPLLVLLAVIFLLSCGGGGNTNSTTPPAAFKGTLTITDSAPDSPQTVSLSGT
jgi:Beta-propeller repeat